MATFKRRGPIIAVWCVGFICFAALIHVLQAPIVPQKGNDAVAEDSAKGLPPPEKGPVLPATFPRDDPSASKMEVEPTVIVEHRPLRSPRRSAERMHVLSCSGVWRPLVQGDVSEQVRSCE
jgi:hypothetical protein